MQTLPSIYTLRNVQIICKVVLFGTYIVIAAIAILLLISFVVRHNPDALGRLLVCVAAFAYIGTTHWLMRRQRYHAAAYLFVTFYTLLASGIVWSWGVNTPIGLLLFGLVIVLSGIILTARHALWAALVCSLILIFVQTAILFGWHIPDMDWATSSSSFGDVFGYSTIFSMLALMSGLYNREMERSLLRAKKVEEALLRQKATLKLQVEKRTAQLRHSQLEEMKQMYRFAELGQLGVTLLHDLANHLTALTLEIEGLQSTQHSKDIARAREIIKYLGGIVDSTRERLHGGMQTKTFNIIRNISDTIAFLNYKATKSEVRIVWQPPAENWYYTGDPSLLSQAVAILTSNAIDAYGPPPTQNTDETVKQRVVTLGVDRNKTHIILTIMDKGRGISAVDRKHIFQLFHSTKKTGMGIGLFIAKQMIETNLSGNLALRPELDRTEFVIKLPLKP